MLIPENLTVRLSCHSFLLQDFMVLIWIHTTKPQICCFRPLQSSAVENFGDQNYGEKSRQNDVSGFCPKSFLDAVGRSQATKNMILDVLELPENIKNHEKLKNTKIGIENEEM